VPEGAHGSTRVAKMMQAVMKLRPTFTEKPARALAAAGGLLLIGVVAILLQMRGGGGASAARARQFFTVDDGKTWFADDASKLPPFDKEGKQAVRAYVYRSGKGKEFVNHLERFTPDARQAIESANLNQTAKGSPKNLAAIQGAYTAGRELKRPGDAKWVTAANFRDAARITSINSPDGAADADPVDP